MIYVGRQLRAIGTAEPALINPELPIAPYPVANAGRDLPPWPSYHLISPTDRAAYLAWLAGGRRDTRVPIGFVQIFFAGLERRVLLDAPHDPAVPRELPVIAAEVRRLRSLHGAGNPSFHACANEFLDVLDLLTAPPATQAQAHARASAAAPPPPRTERLPVPMALRIALAGFAAAGAPVPPAWARSWAWHHPALLPRTPQTRCAQEFDRLFARRYAQRFGAGLVPRPTGAPLEIWYQPASPGLTGARLTRADLPDVLTEPTATRELGVLVDSVTGALDPYSRWLAKTPSGRGTLAATALLPAELLDHDAGPLGHLLAWAGAHLDGRPSALIDAAEFAAFWSTARPERMAKDEAASLALVLSRVGLGVEPDVRFGGPALAPGPAVLFRLDGDAPDGPRPCYLTAMTMLHLAVSVVAAGADAEPDGVDDTFAETSVAAMATTVRLTAGERSRLRARLCWLLAAGVTATGLSRRIAELGQAEREATGHFLIAVAAGMRTVPPAAVTALTRAYRMLGLDPALVIRRLHQCITGGSAARRPPLAEDPVVVRRARAAEPGHALPWATPVRAAPATTTPMALPATATASGVRLCQQTVTQKMTETEAVSTLLATIFSDDDPIDQAQAGAGGPDGVAYLDRRHSDLLRKLATRASWGRADFAELAARHGVLPDGALDLLNEAAIDTAGEPVCEGDDDLTVNRHVLQELLG